MRIAALELIAFGPFRGLNLDLSAPGMHVVYGRNEAGKSTTLRALTALFYGIEPRTQDAHLHKPADLRIGGTLVAGDGTRIEVVRRKGVSKGAPNTLLDRRGQAIDEIVLLRLLGGVGEETFRHAFGLDHDTLELGAKALLDGRGDVGGSLFDASVGGGADARALLAQLTAEADRLYKPRASAPALNDALRAFADAQKAVKERQSLPEAYVAQQRALEEAQARRDALGRRRVELATRRARIERAAARVPLERKRSELRAALSTTGLAEVARHAARIASIHAKLGAYESALATHRDDAATAARLIERIAVAARYAGVEPSGASAQASARATEQASARATGLASEKATEQASAKATEQAGAKAAEQASARAAAHASAKATEQATSQGGPAEGANGREPSAERAPIDARTEARIQRLLQDRATSKERIERAAEEIALRSRELERLREQLARARALGLSAPPALERAALRARSLGDAASRHAAETSKAARRRGDLEARARAIGFFEGTLEELVSVQLPSHAVLDELARGAEELDRVVARHDERVTELDAQLRTTEQQLAEASGDFAPPTAVDLRAARVIRDEVFDRVHNAHDSSALGALHLELDRAIRAADTVADRMIHEADRVTSLARLHAQASTLAEQRARSSEERDEAIAARNELDTRHVHLWRDAGIARKAGPPRSADTRTIDAREADARTAEARPVGARAGRASAAEATPLEKPLAFAEMRAWLVKHAQIIDAFTALREAEHDAAETAQTIESCRSELEAALVGELASGAGRSLAELLDVANERLERVDAARSAASEAEKGVAKLEVEISARMAASAREEAALAESSARLTELVRPLGLDGGASAEEVVRAMETLRELFNLEDQLAAVAARAARAEDEARGFEEEVTNVVCTLAQDLVGAATREAVVELSSRSQRAHAMQQQLADVEEQLAKHGDEIVPHEILELVADHEAADRARASVDAELEEVDRAFTRETHSIGGCEKGLEEMRVDSGAAEASLRAQEALARIRVSAEQYVRAKVAATILAREIERYRQENQGPMLTTASELFARLTLGSYTGVRAGYDESDKPALRCTRPNGDEVGVAALSWGTRDQLYLSLRLASLLRYAELADPMPLVLDDVLIQFDDERARAALAVLADVASRIQVLFFTHHGRLVELAKVAVPPSALTLHELAPPPRSVTIEAASP